MQEMQVQSLGREDPPEKGTATYSRILAWRIPWTKEPGRLLSMGSHRVGHNWATKRMLFQDAKTISQNWAYLVLSLLVDYPKSNPKSRPVTKFFNSNKCQANPDSGQILLLSEATVSKFQEWNWKEVHPKVWLKVVLLVVMDSTKSSGGGGAAGRETYI